MEKMKLHSPDLSQDNIAKIRDLFPGCVSEAADERGKLRLAVDFDQLRQELSDDLVEGGQERYRLDWPGKREALALANAPIAKTLRPAREESVNFDTTQNLFIEGDNLDALKLLQETYLGKIKMIYIDPPYNTGNDFIYEDDFVESSTEFLERSNQKDDQGNRMVANTSANGRFHSDWLSMMYPRLYLARNLLRDDGVIFITIDDHEESNLTLLCDQIFGRENFRAKVSWQKKYSVSNNFKGVASIRDFVLIYSKSDAFQNGLLPRSEESKARYINPDNDPRGPWKPVDYWNVASVEARPNLVYEIVNPNTGKKLLPEKKAWKFSKEVHDEHVKENKIWWGKNGDNKVPALKLFLTDVKDGMIPHNWWPHDEAGHTDEAKKYVDKLFGGSSPFDTPKPLKLLERIIQIAGVQSSDLVLDFFAGSGTTAEAVTRFSGNNGTHLKYIMMQLPELCPKNSEAAKQGFERISDVGKERIRRAGQKMLEGECHPGWNKDVGFRVLKTDTSNMEDVYYRPDEVKQADLLTAVDNVKPDRTAEDLLFQVLVDWGVDLTLPIRSETVQ
ncbi:site-specific DNA-methyltransferase, partial [Marimonas lutisalis]|uniref:site-specific DNA-methyltransferase n=1 Tax=Marimonas lutisalis TaxID=2545756 RepID=UPI0019616383